MGSNQFQKEYIEYLEKKNEELLIQLTLLRENYDNKIFSKDISKHYLVNTLEELMNVCLVLPQEIDLFFDKITSAMQGLKNVLMKKSELVQTVNKISKIISNVKSNSDFTINQESNLVNGPKFELNNGNIGKVLPMIDGHIISTVPKLYLSRLTENLTPGNKNNPIELSPIVEVSPEANLENSDIERLCSKEKKTSLESINTNNLSHYANRESTPSRLTRKRLTKVNEQTVRVSNVSLNDDPLEGTSTMHCDNNQSQVSHSEKFNCFVDFKRRKHRFAITFDNDGRSSGTDLLSEKDKTQSQEKSLLQNKSSCLRSYTDSTSSAKYNRATNNSSQDFIDESVNGEEENERNREISERRVNTSKEENNFENFKKDIKKTTSTPSGVRTKISPKNLYRTDENHQDSVEENQSTDKIDTNSYSKLNSRVSFEGSTKSNNNSKTPLTPWNTAVESRLSGTRKSKKSMILKLKKQKSKSKKKLSSSKNLRKESTLSSKNFIEVSQRDSVSIESGSFQNTSENGCRRAKRKAAPTNLKEPLLSTKLRRN